MRPANHLDARPRPRHRDHLTDPHTVGRRAVTVVIPDGGDKVSAEIARIQHLRVLTWRRGPCAPSGAALTRRFGCAKQTIDRSAIGGRWMGETVMAAFESRTNALDVAEPVNRGGQPPQPPGKDPR